MIARTFCLFVITAYLVSAQAVPLPPVPADPVPDVESEAIIPPDTEVILPLTTAASSVHALPRRLNLITWNVHKGSDTEKWALDMVKLSSESDLLALQEAMHDDFMPGALTRLQGFAFWMAQSFLYRDGRGTGVSTGSRTQTAALDFSRSPGHEPVTNTPKVSLISTYVMEDGKPILVVNIHGINFVANSELRHQLEKLEPVFHQWSGRTIFLGDFNTWNGWRTSYLENYTKDLGFKEVPFADDPRKLVLDHIFIKGCKIMDSKVLSQIKSSDHLPLWASIDCP